MKHICFYFVSVGGVPNVPNVFCDGPINMGPLKKINSTRVRAKPMN